MRALGVGAVYWPALAPLFEDAALVGVLELELQAFWEKVGGWRYLANENLLDSLARLPQRKLLHGVAHPFGGATLDPLNYLSLWRGAIERLDPVWVSEHLSFNRVSRGARVEDAGFLLPPQQTPASAAQAARNIRRFAQDVDRPVAFETGVNYLRPRPDELNDGEFFASVAQGAHCGILLDLHNLWCNERNGRQRVRDALARMPLDRVWEVHLAGGMELSGFQLDAHSDVVAPQLIDLAAEVLPRLPNLGALIFEILPEHAERVGLDAVHRQLEVLHELWRLVPAKEVVVGPAAVGAGSGTTGAQAVAVNEVGAGSGAVAGMRPGGSGIADGGGAAAGARSGVDIADGSGAAAVVRSGVDIPDGGGAGAGPRSAADIAAGSGGVPGIRAGAGDGHRLGMRATRGATAAFGLGADPAAWDIALVDAIRHGRVGDSRFRHLETDPGVEIFRTLITDARRSNLTRAMHYTIMLLLVYLRSARTRDLLDIYFHREPPHPFVAEEADRFACFLHERLPDLAVEVPCLAETCAFEHALIRASLRAESTDLTWSVDPAALFNALDAGRKPEGLATVHSTMRIQAQ